MQGSLAKRLRVLRAERGLTLRQAAAQLDVTPGTLSELERGVRHPHDVTLSRIAKGYGVPVEELLEESVPSAEASEAAGQRVRERIAPRVTRLRSLGLDLSDLRDRERAIEERLPLLKREVPLPTGGTKEEFGEEYLDQIDELFAIRTVLAEDASKQLSPGE